MLEMGVGREEAGRTSEGFYYWGIVKKKNMYIHKEEKEKHTYLPPRISLPLSSPLPSSPCDAQQVYQSNVKI